LSYNLKTCGDKYAVLAGYMENGERRASPPSPKRFIDNLVGLINDLDLPSKPSELGLKKEDAPTLLKNTLVQTRRIKTNPRPLDDELLSYIEKGI
jgi:alcohol dehydrogenase class IV